MFKFKEDVIPFPCEHQKLLEKLIIDDNIINKQKDETSTSEMKRGNEGFFYLF